MPDTLRERIAQALRDGVTVRAGSIDFIVDAILPLVEQMMAEKDAQIAQLQAQYQAVIREVETPLPPDGADYE